MLQALRITDLGVIGDVTVELEPGLCVVTGETGAGKTMVVTGLALLFGGRADASRVRSGAAQAGVEGRIALPADAPGVRRATEAGGDLDDGELILRRVLTAAGRSRAHVGGVTAPIGVLSEIGEHVIAVHGQSDQIRLTRPGEQRGMLDRYAGLDLDAYRDAFRSWQEAAAEFERRSDERVALRRESELLQFGLAEIERVDPRPNEDVELAVEAHRLAAADDLRLAARAAHDAVAGDADDPLSEVANVQSLLAAASRALLAVADADPALADLARRVGELGAGAADLSAELASYTEGIDADPARLAVVEQRRAELTALTRKYGTAPERSWSERSGSEQTGPVGIESVLAWAREAAARLDSIDTSDDAMAQLARRAEQARIEAAALAAEASAIRKHVASELADMVSTELAALSMSDARLFVDVRLRPPATGQPTLPVDGQEAAAGLDGVDDVDFLLRPYPDSPALPLGKGASGGELSRVMLALEVALAGTDPVPVMVFDEVDAGVGGRAAVEVGRRLARLAREHQVIVVTHLAQVAAFADAHYVVGARGELASSKAAPDTPAGNDPGSDGSAAGGSDGGANRGADSGATVSSVVRVRDAQRITELARMLAGRDTDAARDHAAELLADAQRYRDDAQREAEQAEGAQRDVGRSKAGQRASEKQQV